MPAHQIDNGAVRHRHVHRRSGELAVEFRQHAFEFRRGLGRRGNDVLARRPTGPEFGRRHVGETGPGAEGPHGADERLLDTERPIEDAKQRSRAMRRERAGGDDPVGGLDPLLVEANHDRPVKFPTGGRAENDALGAGREVPFQFGPRRPCVAEVDHRRDPQIAPGGLTGAAGLHHAGGRAVDAQAPVLKRHIRVQGPRQGREAQQVAKHLGIRGLGHGPDFDLGPVQRKAKQTATQQSEAHDADTSRGHRSRSCGCTVEEAIGGGG